MSKMQITQKYISEEELRAHNKNDDLWISIHGKIYNVTKWANHHPGGKLPLMYFAGQDVTDPFLAYHPKSASKYLDPFFTGCFLKDFRVSEMSQDYRKLHSDLHSMGLFHKKGHGMLILMLITLMIFMTSVYGVLSSRNLWVHIACAGLMGCSWIQCGWVIHNSGHYEAMINSKLNRIALFVVANCCCGISGAGWKRQHVAHHISTNSLEYDPDTHFMPALVYSSEYINSLTSNYYKRKMHFTKLAKFLISHQNVTYFLLMAFGRPFAYVQSSFYLLFSKKTSSKCLELFGLLLFWSWYSLLLNCLPNWFERIAFMVIALAVSGIQNFQFSLNHVSCDVYLGPLSGKDWIQKQIIGSLNIKCSPWMDWFHGGLQYQIEHHLFPRLPVCQLRKISPFVKELCRKHDIPYNCATSFWEAIISTVITISGVALEVRSHDNPKSGN